MTLTKIKSTNGSQWWITSLYLSLPILVSVEFVLQAINKSSSCLEGNFSGKGKEAFHHLCNSKSTLWVYYQRAVSPKVQKMFPLTSLDVWPDRLIWVYLPMFQDFHLRFDDTHWKNLNSNSMFLHVPLTLNNSVFLKVKEGPTEM